MRRRDVHGAHAMLADDARQQVDAQSVVVDRNADDRGAGQPERFPGGTIAELLHHDDVAGAEQRARDQ